MASLTRDKRNKILDIFLNFKRAFETIYRKILLQKLRAYDIDDIELKWFESYLTNRKHITKINDIKSHIHNEYGSILGALLFVLYVLGPPSNVFFSTSDYFVNGNT